MTSLYCCEVYDSSRVMLGFLGLRLSAWGGCGLDRHLLFERNVLVFLPKFLEDSLKVKFKLLWGCIPQFLQCYEVAGVPSCLICILAYRYRIEVYKYSFWGYSSRGSQP